MRPVRHWDEQDAAAPGSRPFPPYAAASQGFSPGARATAVTVGLSNPRQVRRRTGAGPMGPGPQAGSRYAHRQSGRLRHRCRDTPALVEVSRLWVWMPGRSLTPFEEQTLGEWKAAIHKPVVRCLGQRDARNPDGGGRLPGACRSTTPPRRPWRTSTTPARGPEADALLVLAATERC